MSENIKSKDKIPYEMKLASGKIKKPASNIKPNTSDANLTPNVIGNSTMSLNQSGINLNNKNKDLLMSPNNQVNRTKVF